MAKFDMSQFTTNASKVYSVDLHLPNETGSTSLKVTEEVFQKVYDLLVAGVKEGTVSLRETSLPKAVAPVSVDSSESTEVVKKSSSSKKTSKTTRKTSASSSKKQKEFFIYPDVEKTLKASGASLIHNADNAQIVVEAPDYVWYFCKAVVDKVNDDRAEAGIESAFVARKSNGTCKIWLQTKLGLEHRNKELAELLKVLQQFGKTKKAMQAMVTIANQKRAAVWAERNK